MGKILLSNDRTYYQKLHEMFAEAGFSEFEEQHTKEVYGCFYRKLSVKNENVLKISDSCMAACAGTLIYNKKSGKEALEELYRDYKKDGTDVRKRALGCYAAVILENGQYTVFTDYDGKYAVYYYADGAGRFVVTCRYAHIQMLVHMPVNRYAMIENGIQYCNLGRETPFENIYRLQPYEQLRIAEGRLEVEDLKEKWAGLTGGKKESAESVCRAIEEVEKQYDAVFPKKMLCMTGGLDSRTVLSAMMTGNRKISILSWQGQGLIFNSFIQDRQICQKIADRFQLKLHTPDFSLDYQMRGNESRKKRLEGLGELYHIYAGNEDFHRLFASDAFPEYITCGYYGEPLRSNDKLDPVYHDGFTLDDYLDDFYINKKYKESLRDWEGYRTYLRKKLHDLAERLHIDESAMSREDCLKLHYYYRTLADGQVCLLINNYRYCTHILTEYEIVQRVHRIPYEEKEHAAFEIACIHRLCPEMVEIPLFTHCRMREIDADGLRIKDSAASKAEFGIKGLIERTGRRLAPNLYEKLWAVYSRKVHPNNLPSVNRSIMKEYRNYIKEYEKGWIDPEEDVQIPDCEWDDYVRWEYFMVLMCNASV